VTQLAGQPQPLPQELVAPPHPNSLAAFFEDSGNIPYSSGPLYGGAAILTAQSQCPFKAFATARLAAQDWDFAEAGLTPKQRGNLLHAVLHSIWAGPPQGIRTSAELIAKLDSGLAPFVAEHVQRVFRDKLPSEIRDRMPTRYLDLEQARLTTLLTQWLEYESVRVPFNVEGTEVPAAVVIAGLELKLRLDRIDRLVDNTLLVIDYKTGDVNPKSWNPPRPDDVQLPLYAGFAPDVKNDLGGLVFAKIRPGKHEFAGCVVDAKSTLLPKARGNTNLVKRPLTPFQLSDWRKNIEQLAFDFLAGRANVDPRAYPDTCKNCGLQTICRILENRQSIDEAAETQGAVDE
jgi:hypothetical protein